MDTAKTACIELLKLCSSSVTPCSIYEDDPFYEAKLFNFTLTVFIAVFGLASNCVVVAVNSKIRILSSTDVYITALAVTDNILILSISLYAYR